MEPARDNVVGARESFALWALAFATSALVGIHGLAYWDAGDYVRLSIEGGGSGLLLGRPLFLLVSRLILSAGVEPASAEMVLRWFWTGVSAIAAPAFALLAARLGFSRRASIAAGIAIAVSPSFAHSAHQVMTDAPALAMTICALIAAASGHAIVAGLLMAVAILTRETAAIHLVAMAMLLRTGPRALRPRAPLLALVVVTLAIALTLVMFPPASFEAWVRAMSRSVQTHPITMWQVAAPLVWILAAGPIPVVVGAYFLWRRRGLAPSGRWLVISAPAAIGTILLLFYPDGSYSPRYMLATVPLAFFLPAAQWMADRPRVMTIAFVLPLVILFVSTRPAQALALRGNSVIDRVALLPQRALVVPGHFCPHARLGATINGRRDLTMMCPGWDWPADPAAGLDAALANGRPVALDLADDAWLPRELDDRNAIRAWAMFHSGRNVSGFLVVEK